MTVISQSHKQILTFVWGVELKKEREREGGEREESEDNVGIKELAVQNVDDNLSET